MIEPDYTIRLSGADLSDLIEALDLAVEMLDVKLGQWEYEPAEVDAILAEGRAYMALSTRLFNLRGPMASALAILDAGDKLLEDGGW